MFHSTQEAFIDMRNNPEISYRCGTFALAHMARVLYGTNYSARALLREPSPATGFSLQALADLSQRLNLRLAAVNRGVDQSIPVPSVIHWSQNHYAAIVENVGEVYKVVDPTFGSPIYLSADAINAEASGYFLLAANQMPVNWRLVGAAEAAAIFGRGNPNFMLDANDQQCPKEGQPPCCPPGAGGGPAGGPAGSGGGPNGRGTVGKGSDSRGGSQTDGDGGGIVPDRECSDCESAFAGSTGMPVWKVSEPYINLWLNDEPFAYRPAIGPRIAFQLSFKQRDEDNDPSSLSSSVGSGWNCSWLSRVQITSLFATVYLPAADSPNIRDPEPCSPIITITCDSV
jgi:hypothetical protein